VAISITFSYPLIFFSCRDGLLNMFGIKNRNNTNMLNQVALAILAIITILASRLTDLGLVAAISGATFGTALVFVYPAIMFLKSQKVQTRENIPAILIGALGLAMGTIGAILSFKS
jgi:amino acid permease